MSSSASEILRQFMYHYGCHIFIEVLFWWRMSAHRAHCCSAVIHHVVTQVEERKDGVLFISWYTDGMECELGLIIIYGLMFTYIW